jgi:hypothetical protein
LRILRVKTLVDWGTNFSSGSLTTRPRLAKKSFARRAPSWIYMECPQPKKKCQMRRALAFCPSSLSDIGINYHTRTRALATPIKFKPVSHHLVFFFFFPLHSREHVLRSLDTQKVLACVCVCKKFDIKGPRSPQAGLSVKRYIPYCPLLKRWLLQQFSYTLRQDCRKGAGMAKSAAPPRAWPCPGTTAALVMPTVAAGLTQSRRRPMHHVRIGLARSHRPQQWKNKETAVWRPSR